VIPCHIREARLPDDEPAILGFIEALQRYEAAFETNRRLDARFVEDHYDTVLKDAAKGIVLIAEDAAGAPVGWALAFGDEAPVYVTESERRFAFLAELYVSETIRGKGVGRALIAACENWARTVGFSTMRIGHLAHNERAARVYIEAGYSPYAVQVRKRL
jgi:GNAT superfamily N-acetyltransferase